VENYKILFKEPDPYQTKKGMVKNLFLELTELGQYECFGEDYDVVSNFLLNPAQIGQRLLPYTVISCMPLECYTVRKKDFYEYIDYVTRKQFLKYIRKYPEDKDLRRFYFEQQNWSDFRSGYIKDRVHTPPQIKSDKKRMASILKEDEEIEKRKAEIILPKIDKRAQNRQRIIGWNKFQQKIESSKKPRKNTTIGEVGDTSVD